MSQGVSDIYYYCLPYFYGMTHVSKGSFFSKALSPQAWATNKSIFLHDVHMYIMTFSNENCLICGSSWVYFRFGYNHKGAIKSEQESFLPKTRPHS